MTALDPAGATARTRRFPLAVALGVLLSAANLRPAVTGVGPVLGRIEAGAGLSAGELAVLTAAPVLCFGLVAPLARPAMARWGAARAQAGALALLAAGSVLRAAVPGASALLIGTVAAAGAIAVLNVVLPAVVKLYFPGRTGLMTGAYTTVLGISSAVAASTAIPVSRAAGWEAALGLWALPALVAGVLWWSLRSAPPPRSALAAAPRPHRTLLRDAVAWQVTGFMALQSMTYYSVVTWLPQMLQGLGRTEAAAGRLLALLMVVGLPLALLVPPAAVRAGHQRVFVVALVGANIIGLLGLLLVPGTSPVLWTVLLGVGLGGSFPLALTLVVLRARTAEDAAALSGMAQGIGYLIAAAGPPAVGLLHEATGSWEPTLGFLVVVAAAQLAVGLGAARPRNVGA